MPCRPRCCGICNSSYRLQNQWLNDSKKLNEKRRNELRIVVESEAVSWGVGFVSPKEIDKINILQASFLAMHRAIDKLKKSQVI